jgi:hypothetical protein
MAGEFLGNLHKITQQLGWGYRRQGLPKLNLSEPVKEPEVVPQQPLVELPVFFTFKSVGI